MDILFYVFAGATGVAASLAAIAIWAPRPTRVRVVALAIAMLFIPVVYAQSIEMLSKPKPASFEWYERAAENAELLGVSFEEGRSIYLWLRIAGVSEPRSYVIPWSEEEARELQAAMQEAESNGGEVRMRAPFSNRPQTDEPMFYAQPQPSLSAKPNAG